METVMMIATWILANYQAILAGLVATLSGVMAIAMVIPGEEPEKTLQKILDFISKWSKKK